MCVRYTYLLTRNLWVFGESGLDTLHVLITKATSMHYLLALGKVKFITLNLTLAGSYSILDT